SAAVMTSFASALAASCFIYAPQFSFLIQDPRHIGELVFILVLAITASKAIGVIRGDPLARGREKTLCQTSSVASSSRCSALRPWRSDLQAQAMTLAHGYHPASQ